MRLLIIPVIAGTLTFAATPALAFEWIYNGESRTLIGWTGEEEGDTDFRATCKAGGKAEIGIGAAEGVGTGEGEAVAVTLATGAHTLTIDGHSRKSPNFQMTAGVELQTDVDAKHAVFQMLAEPGAIKLSSGKTISASWPAAGRAAATKTFLKACFGS